MTLKLIHKTQIEKLRDIAFDRAYNSGAPTQIEVMNEMIAEAYHEGRKRGHSEMASQTQDRFAHIIGHHFEE